MSTLGAFWGMAGHHYPTMKSSEGDSRQADATDVSLSVPALGPDSAIVPNTPHPAGKWRALPGSHGCKSRLLRAPVPRPQALVPSLTPSSILAKKTLQLDAPTWWVTGTTAD